MPCFRRSFNESSKDYTKLTRGIAVHSEQVFPRDSIQLEKEAKLRTVIESVPNGIIMVDETGNITFKEKDCLRTW